MKLTFWWIGAFVLLIVPLRTIGLYEKRIQALEEEITWHKVRWLDCVDAGNMQRLYIGDLSSNWVEFSCNIVKDNTLSKGHK